MARITLSITCRLQLINTSINTFFSKLSAFLSKTKKEEGRPMMVKRKLDGAVDRSSADRKIHKLDITEKSGGLHLEPGLMAGHPSVWQMKFG